MEGLDVEEYALSVPFLRRLPLERIRCSAVPYPRALHAAAPGEEDGTVYLFGGVAEGAFVLDDLWKFDPQWTNWQLCAPVTSSSDADGVVRWPCARCAHTLCTFNGGLYLFGGTDGDGNLLNDLWKYEESEWMEVETEGEKPPPRRGHAATVLGSTLFIFGGETISSSTRHPKETKMLNDLWMIDLENGGGWRRSKILGSVRPCERSDCVLVAGRSGCFLYGGRVPKRDSRESSEDTLKHHKLHVLGKEFTALGDLWLYDQSSGKWTELRDRGSRPKVPDPRCSCFGVSLSTNELLIHGGIGNEETTFRDFWTFDSAVMQWKQVFPFGEEMYPSRAEAAVCVSTDFEGPVAYFHGGVKKQSKGDEFRLLDDLWILKLDSIHEADVPAAMHLRSIANERSEETELWAQRQMNAIRWDMLAMRRDLEWKVSHGSITEQQTKTDGTEIQHPTIGESSEALTHIRKEFMDEIQKLRDEQTTELEIITQKAEQFAIGIADTFRDEVGVHRKQREGSFEIDVMGRLSNLERRLETGAKDVSTLEPEGTDKLFEMLAGFEDRIMDRVSTMIQTKFSECEKQVEDKTAVMASELNEVYKEFNRKHRAFVRGMEFQGVSASPRRAHTASELSKSTAVSKTPPPRAGPVSRRTSSMDVVRMKDFRERSDHRVSDSSLVGQEESDRITRNLGEIGAMVFPERKLKSEIDELRAKFDALCSSVDDKISNTDGALQKATEDFETLAHAMMQVEFETLEKDIFHLTEELAQHGDTISNHEKQLEHHSQIHASLVQFQQYSDELHVLKDKTEATLSDFSAKLDAHEDCMKKGIEQTNTFLKACEKEIRDLQSCDRGLEPRISSIEERSKQTDLAIAQLEESFDVVRGYVVDHQSFVKAHEWTNDRLVGLEQSAHMMTEKMDEYFETLRTHQDTLEDCVSDLETSKERFDKEDKEIAILKEKLAKGESIVRAFHTDFLQMRDDHSEKLQKVELASSENQKFFQQQLAHHEKLLQEHEESLSKLSEDIITVEESVTVNVQELSKLASLGDDLTKKNETHSKKLQEHEESLSKLNEDIITVEESVTVNVQEGLRVSTVIDSVLKQMKEIVPRDGSVIVSCENIEADCAGKGEEAPVDEKKDAELIVEETVDPKEIQILDKKVDAVSVDVIHIGRAIASIRNRLDISIESVESILSTMSTIEEKERQFATITQNVIDANGRIEQLETTSAEMMEDVVEMEARLDDIETAQEEARDSVHMMDARCGGLDEELKQVATTQEPISHVTTTVKTFVDRLCELSSRLEAIDGHFEDELDEEEKLVELSEPSLLARLTDAVNLLGKTLPQCLGMCVAHDRQITQLHKFVIKRSFDMTSMMEDVTLEIPPPIESDDEDGEEEHEHHKEQERQERQEKDKTDGDEEKGPTSKSSLTEECESGNVDSKIPAHKSCEVYATAEELSALRKDLDVALQDIQNLVQQLGTTDETAMTLRKDSAELKQTFEKLSSSAIKSHKQNAENIDRVEKAMNDGLLAWKVRIVNMDERILALERTSEALTTAVERRMGRRGVVPGEHQTGGGGGEMDGVSHAELDSIKRSMGQLQTDIRDQKEYVKQLEEMISSSVENNRNISDEAIKRLEENLDSLRREFDSMKKPPEQQLPPAEDSGDGKTHARPSLHVAEEVAPSKAHMSHPVMTTGGDNIGSEAEQRIEDSLREWMSGMLLEVSTEMEKDFADRCDDIEKSHEATVSYLRQSLDVHTQDTSERMSLLENGYEELKKLSGMLEKMDDLSKKLESVDQRMDETSTSAQSNHSIVLQNIEEIFADISSLKDSIPTSSEQSATSSSSESMDERKTQEIVKQHVDGMGRLMEDRLQLRVEEKATTIRSEMQHLLADQKRIILRTEETLLSRLVFLRKELMQEVDKLDSSWKRDRQSDNDEAMAVSKKVADSHEALEKRVKTIFSRGGKILRDYRKETEDRKQLEGEISSRLDTIERDIIALRVQTHTPSSSSHGATHTSPQPSSTLHSPETSALSDD